MAAPQTPKPSSGEFRQLHQRLCSVLDAPTLVVLLFTALDRRRLEGIFNKFSPHQGRRAQVLEKEQLVGAIGGWFFSMTGVAHAVVRDMDKVCRKERHIVTSLPDDSIAERLQRYQALDFRREHAKLAWALLRDDRSEAHQAATALFTEMVDRAQQESTDTSRNDATESQRDTALRQRLETYESMVSEAHGKVRGLEGAVSKLERERAELMGVIGRKERALRAEELLRKKAEEDVKRAEKNAQALKQELASLGPEDLAQLAEERDKLAKKLRRMEKKGRVTLEIEKLSSENTELKSQVDRLEQLHEEGQKERQNLLQTLNSRQRASHEQVVRLRQSLKTARRMAAEQPASEAEAPHQKSERIGVFVDAANLSASALRLTKGQFDFAALLDLVDQRSLAIATAYVVDNGQPGFQKFTNALRDMGYRIKIRKPARRADGTVKADWDMGIAMDVIDLRHRIDTALIASGDGDFLPLVRRLRRWQMRVEVAAFEHALHPELKRTADRFWPLTSSATT